LTDSSKITRRRYLKYASAGILAGAAAVASGGFYSYQSNQEEASREFNRSLYPPRKLRVGSKGMCYNLGPYGQPRSFSWDRKRDIKTIHDVLGCDGIRIFGNDEGSLIECVGMALEEEFQTIILNPRWFDAMNSMGIEETLSKFDRFTKKIGNLRDPSLVLAIGNELSVDTRGILSDEPMYDNRVPAIVKKQNDETCQKKLEKLVRDLIAIARSNTDVKLTYCAGSWEWWLPWDELDLDILGDNHYWYKDYGDPEDPDNSWFRHIREYKRHTGKRRYFITEYECSPYKGSFDLGGGDWIPNVPLNKKDEEAQAQYIGNYHKMFNKADDLGLHIDGSFYMYYWGTNAANESSLVEPGGLVEHQRRAFFEFASWEKQQIP